MSLDTVLSAVKNDGEELELGPINFVPPLKATPNATTGDIDVGLGPSTEPTEGDVLTFTGGVWGPAAAAAGGGPRFDTLISSGNISAGSLGAGNFVEIDVAGAGSYVHDSGASSLFEPGTGLDLHYTGSADLTVLARLTVTVLAGGSDFTGAIAIDDGAVIGHPSSIREQRQTVKSTVARQTITVESILTVNNSSSSHIKAAFCSVGGSYSTDVVFERATLSVLY